MKLADWARLAASVVACELVGLMGSVFTVPSIPAWYAGLAKPAFTPPSWVFGPVWTILYFLMGVSLFLVWRRGQKARGWSWAMCAFSFQLALNLLWSAVFFGARSPFYGLVVIALLWVSIAVTIRRFWKLSRPAAGLLVPYFLWVSFAGVLNYYLWLLNP